MQATWRQRDPGLIGLLLDTPWSFEFFQALRLLDRHLGDGDVSSLSSRIRFRNSLRLGLAPSELEAVNRYSHRGENEAEARGQTDANDTFVVTPAFIGLLGVHGALPAHYTEQVCEAYKRRRDEGPHAFFDLLSDRSIALFYLAWRKHKPHLLYETDRDRHLLPQLLSLCGLGASGVRHRLASPPEAHFFAHFAGLIRQRPTSAHAVERVLSACFEVKVRIEQFVGTHYFLKIGQQLSLGRANAILGGDALLGERVWQCNLRVRLFIGPLPAVRYQNFVPGSGEVVALTRILGLLTGGALECEIRPVLLAREVRCLGLTADSAWRLGYGAILCSRSSASDRNDAAFEVRGSEDVPETDRS